MISYKKLFHLLIDRNMKESELIRLAGLSAPILKKLRENQNINTTTINKICAVLDVQPSEILEYIPEEKEQP